MTFVHATSAFARRFLSDRTFDLIVLPALADFEFDAGRDRVSRARGMLAIVRAVAGGACDDMLSGAGLWTFGGLVVIPACYYCCLFVLLSPVSHTRVRNAASAVGNVTVSDVVAVTVAVLALSIVPAIACMWPNRPETPSPEE